MPPRHHHDTVSLVAASMGLHLFVAVSMHLHAAATTPSGRSPPPRASPSSPPRAFTSLSPPPPLPLGPLHAVLTAEPHRSIRPPHVAPHAGHPLPHCHTHATALPLPAPRRCGDALC
ncbi:hypothetical protein GUJ93_ZPchr0007g5362 [Zizania palustris]|uniref:Uncharacterized protein n=1 Tax=Zizania palustris TaxID=103762 RepID=A0A8J5SUY7_ZIZPA|nr:hypothetical protein GUJ93_ZPchr0007g5362 [Zizania palustris]